MRIDNCARTVLTVIALLLGAIALRPILEPAPASAQTPLAGVQFSSDSDGFKAFNTVTGDVWKYSYDGVRYSAKYLGRIAQLGQPMVNTLHPPAQR